MIRIILWPLSKALAIFGCTNTSIVCTSPVRSVGHGLSVPTGLDTQLGGSACASTGEVCINYQFAQHNYLLVTSTVAIILLWLGFSSHFEVSSCLGLLDEDQILSVGGALGLAYNVLKKMKSLPGDMVAAWLRKEDFVSEEPTWRTLIEALKRVGQAEELLKIF